MESYPTVNGVNEDIVHDKHYPGVLCDIGYMSKKHLKPKSRETSFIHYTCFNNLIVLKLCTEKGSNTAVLCERFQNDWTAETNVMNER